MKQEPLVIYTDSREPQRLHDLLVVRYPDIEFRRIAMDKGDYGTLGLTGEGENEYADVLIERKKLGDLNGSITDGRLVNQWDKIATKQGLIYVLMVTGNLIQYIAQTKTQKYMPDANADMLLSAIASVSVRYGSHVLWIESESEAFGAMVKFIKHVKKNRYMVPAKRDYSNVCARLLGVTVPQWKNVTRRFGPITEIACATEEELQSIVGIGPVKAAHIIKVLNYGET